MKLNFYLVKTGCFLFAVFSVISNKSLAQSYGLGFKSYEVMQDKRTSLDLSPGNTLRLGGNFDLSFNMSFLPNYPMYYGYIVRIIENDRRNIDIVYNVQGDKNYFYVVIDGRFSKINFNIDRSKLFSQWNNLKLRFNLVNDQLVLFEGNRVFTERGLHLKKDAFYKIIFGTNNYKTFQTTDAPPMKLRDIKISQNNKVKYHWPLNEMRGNVAHEVISKKNAAVSNPLWMLAKHHDWQLTKSFIVEGSASTAFSSDKETLYIVGSDSLYSYSVSTAKWHNKHSHFQLNLMPGNKSVYNKFDNSLYNFFVDTNIVQRYDFKTFRWIKESRSYMQLYRWDINNLISVTDTSLYFFGGYGHHIYKNDVPHYNFKSKSWITEKTKGDFFIPRYLSGLGATLKGDTAYILGGYGDSSGRQILNPRTLYDMMRFTVKDKTFKRLFEIKNSGEDFAFANSMVIDDKKKKYYALIFPQNRYKSNLQLICGSLTMPDYRIVGNIIPYDYNDTHSFADLYYAPVSEVFMAVTLLRSENNQTQVNIYTLQSPPVGLQARLTTKSADKTFYLYIEIALLAFCVIVAYVVLRKKRKKKVVLPDTKEYELIKTQPQEIEDDPKEIENFNVEKGQFKNTILLFGDLRIFDTDGIEITKFFTPLIKELFLVILLYTIRWGRGLSSAKLNEILWSDKDPKSARNNRSVNIAKLKSVLERMKCCTLSKDSGNWKIAINDNYVYVDYSNYLNIIKEKGSLSVEKINDLSVITQRGGFLSNTEYEWLDQFKSEISNQVIDTYLHFAHSMNATSDNDFLIELANFIFHFDPVNEDAMIIKCKALFNLGKHSLAKNTFENFAKEYKMIYKEDFKLDFNAILE